MLSVLDLHIYTVVINLLYKKKILFPLGSTFKSTSGMYSVYTVCVYM